MGWTSILYKVTRTIIYIISQKPMLITYDNTLLEVSVLRTLLSLIVWPEK